MSNTKQSTFMKLYKTDVSKYTEKKGQFSYISWATAWDHVSRAYPNVTFTKKLSDIQGFVSVSITIEDRTLTEEFPILDYKNKPVAQPNAFQINTAFQRGLVKCLGMFGYGLFIYKGEDLPPDNVPRETIQEQPKDNYVDENSHTDTLEKEGFETAINGITSIKELTDWGVNNGDKIKESNHTDYVRGIFASRKTALEDRV